MKKLKRIFASLLSCLLIACCCFNLVACDVTQTSNSNESTTTSEQSTPTPSTTTEHTTSETTSQPSIQIFSPEIAETLYYEAVTNSLTQSQRKSVCNTYHTMNISIEKVGSVTNIIKNNVIYAELSEVDDTTPQIGWLINDKYYAEDSKLYLESDDFGKIDDFIDMFFIATNAICMADTIEFGNAILVNDTYKINLDVQLPELYSNIWNITIYIQSGLISQMDMIIRDFDTKEIDSIHTLTLSYDNIEFPHAIPTDLDTYQKGPVLNPLT